MSKYFLIVLVTLAITASAQAQAVKKVQPKPASTGSWGVVQDGKFVSDRLRFSLPIPSDLTVISTAEADVLSNAGADMIKQGSKSDARIDEAVGRTIRLIAVAEKPIGSPQNSVLEIVAIKQQSGVTANMSLAANLALLKGSTYTLKRSLGSMKLGVNRFAAAELDAAFGDVKVAQRMYVVMHKGYSIVCAITYSSDKQRADMEEVLSSLSLNP